MSCCDWLLSYLHSLRDTPETTTTLCVKVTYLKKKGLTHILNTHYAAIQYLHI